MAKKKGSGKKKDDAAVKHLELAFFIMPGEGLKNLREELEFTFMVVVQQEPTLLHRLNLVILY